MTLKILAVDDEAGILDLIERSLSDEGHQVTVAASLGQAQACLEGGGFDLFIIDIGLSDGSGLDLVQAIRKERVGWIIMLSARRDVTDKVVALELGADDYIVKPFHMRELQARVQAVQRRILTVATTHPAESHRTRRLCGYTIDAEKRRVTGADHQNLHLTTNEFNVLWALVEQNGKVLTRDSIVRAAFGDQRAMGGRPVDGLISRLREKLFPDGSGPLRIRTIHGRGYQISG